MSTSNRGPASGDGTGETPGEPAIFGSGASGNLIGLIGLVSSVLAAVSLFAPSFWAFRLMPLLWLVGLVLSGIGLFFRPRTVALFGLGVTVLNVFLFIAYLNMAFTF